MGCSISFCETLTKSLCEAYLINLRTSSPRRGCDWLTLLLPFWEGPHTNPTLNTCSSHILPGQRFILIRSWTVKASEDVSPLPGLWKEKGGLGLQLRCSDRRASQLPQVARSEEKPHDTPGLIIDDFYFCSHYVPLKIPKCLEFLIPLGPEVTALYGNTGPWLSSPLRS